MAIADLFVLNDLSPSMLLIGQYDNRLVGLSLIIAIISSYMALTLSAIAQRSASKTAKQIHLTSGSLSLGIGIWSMHFIGMLAFSLCTEVNYDLFTTIASLLPSFIASLAALSILSHSTISLRHIGLGGLAVGAGIGAMHYTGMAAMVMAPELKYDLPMFLLSIVVAVALASLALWVSFGLRQHLHWRGYKLRAIASLVMGLAIAGMHYIGMASARFIGTPMADFDPVQESHYTLALIIGAVTIVISLMVVTINALGRYRSMLRQSEDISSELQAMFDTAVDGIIKMSATGIVQSYNRSAEQILGYKAEEVIGNNINMLMPEPHRSAHDGYLAHYLKTGERKIIGVGREVSARHKEGHEIHIRLSVAEMTQSGKTYFCGFITDISQQKKITRELKERENQLRTLIRNIPGASFRCLWDEQWSMLFISDRVKEITGYPAKEFLDSTVNFADLIDPDDNLTVSQALAMAAEKQEAYVVEYRITHKNDAVRWLEEFGTPVLDEQGNVKWIDGILLDISSRKVLELQLLAAKNEAIASAKAKGAFLANMSHEIRTPMNSIIGFTDLLLDTPLNERQQKKLNIVRSSARSLLSLLNGVLDTAKLESGSLELEERIFSLNALCEQLIATLSLTAARKKLDLTLHYSPELDEYFCGDSLRIQQVILNLLSNAVKFTEQGGVTLTLSPGQSGEVCFEVRDTGIGIAEDRLEGIFEPFAQADSSMTRRFGGTGLGTTISKQLIDLMGGRIHVTSTLGQGSVFTVTLPLQATTPDQAALDEAHRRVPIVKLPPLKVLVADDVEQNIELITTILENHGHTVIPASNGLEAIEYYLSEHPDVILMDVQMPELNGHEATQRIRTIEKAERKKVTPVIALTASVMEEDRRLALAAGMNGFATKPLEVEKLLMEVAHVLGLCQNSDADDQTITTAIAAETEIALPAETINEHKGITLWGSQVQHYKAIAKFLRDPSNQIGYLSERLSQSQTIRLMELHRIKGAAGNLCLPDLALWATQQERFFKENAAWDKDTQETLLQQYQRLIDQIKDAMPLQEMDTEAASSDKEPTATVDVTQLQALISVLQTGEIPETLFQQISHQLPDTLASDVELCLENFEPDNAARLLNDYLQEMKTHATS